MGSLKLVYFFLIIAVNYTTGLERNIGSTVKEKIDDFITNVFLPYSGVSGLGLSVVQNDGERQYATGYGLADNKKTRNGNNTQFLLGSVTKTFTSLVVVKSLHDNFPELGESVLDTPIKQLIPNTNFTLIDRFRSEYATFRDLLSHKMCIPRDDFQLMAEPFETTGEILFHQRYAEESCSFRTQFMYNNHMVLYAAQLASEIQNQPFTEMADQLLKQIGMTDSSFATSEPPSERALPYYILDNKRYEINPNLINRLKTVPAIGGLYVTPNDMTVLLHLFLNKGVQKQKRILPEYLITWITKASTVVQKIKYRTTEDQVFNSPISYGLGVMIGSYKDWQRISHNGYFTPYRTELSWYPNAKIGIYSSTHEAPSNVKLQVLHNFIFDTLMGYDNAEANAVKELEGQLEKMEREEIGKVRTLDKFLDHCKSEQDNNLSSDVKIIEENAVGVYGRGVSGVATITWKFDALESTQRLYLSYGKWARGWMNSIGGNAYSVTWDTDLTQDYIASGDKDGIAYVRVGSNGMLEFVRPTHLGMITYAVFEKSVDIDKLPSFMWKHDTC